MGADLVWNTDDTNVTDLHRLLCGCRFDGNNLGGIRIKGGIRPRMTRKERMGADLVWNTDDTNVTDLHRFLFIVTI